MPIYDDVFDAPNPGRYTVFWMVVIFVSWVLHSVEECFE